MTFPAIATADTKTGTVTSNSATWTFTYPTNLVAGDLILSFHAADGNVTLPTFPGGWTQILARASGGAVTLNVAAKVSNGTESGDFSVAIGASEQGSWRVFRISGWYGGVISAGLVTDSSAGVSGNSALGVDTTPDPPSLDPADWGTVDTLWIAACSADTSRTISAFPLGSNQTADVSGGAGGATLGLCSTNSAVGSLDPSTFTISASDEWNAATVAIRPAASLAFPRQDLLHFRNKDLTPWSMTGWQ